MEFGENPGHLAIRETVAKIAAPYGGAYYTRHAEEHTPAGELWHALGRQGFIGINLPEEFGGGGAGLAELALVCEETAAQGAPLLLLLVSSAISGEILARYGSRRQQEDWLPGLASCRSGVSPGCCASPRSAARWCSTTSPSTRSACRGRTELKRRAR